MARMMPTHKRREELIMGNHTSGLLMRGEGEGELGWRGSSANGYGSE